MKIIMNVRITQGYEKWVELFHSANAVREQFGITVLAYGHDKDDDSSVYQVLEMDSMERMQEAMSNPELQKMRTDAGVDLESQRVTFLVEQAEISAWPEPPISSHSNSSPTAEHGDGLGVHPAVWGTSILVAYFRNLNVDAKVESARVPKT